MRILYIIESLEFGGAEKMLVSLANGFAQEHSITVCCIKTTGVLRQELDPRIRVICLEKPEGPAYGLVLRLWRVMQEGHYDVLHTHNWSVFAECGVAAILARIPIRVHTSHGRYAPVRTTMGARLKLWLRHRLERVVSYGYSQIVTVSDSIQQTIGDAVGIPANRLITIHNGIDPGEPVSVRTRSAITFVSVGRLVPIKRHDVMIEAFAEIAQDSPDARLLVIGDGPERSRLEELIRKRGVEGKVQLTGFRHDIPDLLADSDIFLLTSGYEGISIALLEAMRAGLPSIATRVGGIPETIVDGQTGLLVDPADANALRRAMVELGHDTERRASMSREARSLLEREFSVDRMRSRYRSLYLAGSAGNGAAR